MAAAGGGVLAGAPGRCRTSLAAAVVELLEPRPGERAWDLYGGAGLFAAALADQVGPDGSVTVVESDPAAGGRARRGAGGPAARSRWRVGRGGAVLGRPDGGTGRLVVLDPPRSGAGRERGATRWPAARPGGGLRRLRPGRVRPRRGPVRGSAGWRLARSCAASTPSR